MNRTIRQPSLAELTDRMIAAKLSASVSEVDQPEVEPYEVMNGFRTDPRTAYTEATAALKLFGAAVPTTLPPEWASFVQLATGNLAIPFAAGQFPQQVRDVAGLLEAPNIMDLAPTGFESMAGFTALRSWAKKQPTSALATGIIRALGESSSITGTDLLSQNEQAATAWLKGDHAEAIELWASMPVSPVVSFNLGMSLLFTGRSHEAIQHLQTAVDTLPESSGWSHLASLYLAVARSR